MVEEQPKHLNPCFIGKDFKEPSCFSQFNLLPMYSYIRFNESSQILFYNLLRAQLTPYLMFSQCPRVMAKPISIFRAMLNLSFNTGGK
jgi:hypothetical protein